MKPGAKNWMLGKADLMRRLPHPDETWMVKDIRKNGNPTNGQALKSYGIAERVERPGYGKSNTYRTTEDAYEYIQTRFAGETPEVEA